MVRKIVFGLLFGTIMAFLYGVLVRDLDVGELIRELAGKLKEEKPEVGEPEQDKVVTKTATLPTGRIRLACAENSATHKIYCFGGCDWDGCPLNEIVEYSSLVR